MIGTMTQNWGQFRIGRYYGLDPDLNVKNSLFFEYEIVNSHEQNYNQIVKNLITPNTVAIIKTTWRHDWNNQAFVTLQDERVYMIEKWQGDDDDVNPQAEAFIIDGLHTKYYMTLTGAEEAQTI